MNWRREKLLRPILTVDKVRLKSGVKDLGLSRAIVYRLVKKFQNGGSSDRKLGSVGEFSNKNRSANRKIADRLRWNPGQLVRKSRERLNSKIHGSSIRLKGLETENKKDKEKALTSPQKAKRETRSRTLGRSLGNDSNRGVFLAMKNIS